MTFEPAKQCLNILYPAEDFCTERYGKLSNQQLFFRSMDPLYSPVWVWVLV